MTIKKDNLHNNLCELINGNVEYFNHLSDNDLKSISPYLFMLWGIGINIDRDFHNIALNEYVNKHFFSISSKHKKLLIALLCKSLYEPGAKLNYIIKKHQNNKKVSVDVIMETYNYNINHAKEALELLSVDQLIVMAENLGYDNEKIKTIKREFNKE